MGAGRVLVIDDDLAMGKAMQRMLSEEFEVTVATSGADGLARIRENHDFDAIVTDVCMPGLDGAAVFATLRDTLPSLADRVLFVSGEGMPASLTEQGLEHRFVQKPFSCDDLLDNVRRLVWSSR